MSAVKIFKEKLANASKIAEDEAMDNAIREVMSKLGPKVSENEIRAGIKVEQEHGPSGPMKGVFDITNGNNKIPLLVTAAHLAEIPDYYTRLAKMEEEGKRAWGEHDGE